MGATSASAGVLMGRGASNFIGSVSVLTSNFAAGLSAGNRGAVPNSGAGLEAVDTTAEPWEGLVRLGLGSGVGLVEK